MTNCRPIYLIALLLTGFVLVLQIPLKATARAVLGKAKGQRTTAEVIAALEPTIAGRFAKVEELTDGRDLAILAFKEEQVVQLYKNVGSKKAASWTFVKSWPFTATCGQSGPKLKEGDRQIPEGVYGIEYLNPNSSYHLSIKIDYPNAFDRRKAESDGRSDLGGDIMIHGSAITVGCVPIGNPGIEELFYLVAKNGYKNTKIIFAPRDLRGGTQAPDVESVTWETDLYALIRRALEVFPEVP